MFNKGTLVTWTTKTNTFMGRVLESRDKTSIVLITSTAKGTQIGQKVVVANDYVGDISSGKTMVRQSK